MSEAWIIFIIGILWGLIQAGIFAVLCWIATEIRNTRKELSAKVERDDCENVMCKHEQEIRNLWEKNRTHGERIAKLER